jgi:hypothetical protein
MVSQVIHKATRFLTSLTLSTHKDMIAVSITGREGKVGGDGDGSTSVRHEIDHDASRPVWASRPGAGDVFG